MTVAKFLPAVLLAVAAASSGVAHAQGALKIGVINVSRLLEQSPQAEAVTKRLQDEFAPRQRDIQAAQNRLQQQQDRFQKDSAVMGEEERLGLERQIRDGQRDLQRTQNEYLEDLNARRNEEVGKLQRDVLLKVQDFARAQKYDLVLADAIYVGTALDITDQVLAVLKGPGGAAAAPAPKK
ncbi:MAG TPA: OmpH family outer membrane protein [Gammaproteobacteria bacterium]|jgi:outer membrane protein|nr:OmpH family outer membrane protein [Gammaproteobacteria bacterium]